MSSNNSATAAQRALGITELLEMTLSHLCTKDLTRTRRVRKNWNDVITTSKVFKQTLFIEPAPHTRYLCRKQWPEHGDSVISETPLPNGDTLIIGTPHPILAKAITSINEFAECTEMLFSLEKFSKIMEITELENVFLTQPPCKSFNCSFDDYVSGPRYFKSDTGFTIRQFCEELHSAAERDRKWAGSNYLTQTVAAGNCSMVVVQLKDLIFAESEYVRRAEQRGPAVLGRT